MSQANHNKRGKKAGKYNQPVTKGQVKSMIMSTVNNSLVRKYIATATGTTVTPSSISNTGTMYSLDSIAGGSGNQARVGNNAMVKEITYNANLYPDSTDGINVFRVVMFRWNDNTTAVVGDLFLSSNYSTSYYNIENIKTGKLVILFDKSYCTGSTSSGAKHCHIGLKQNHAIAWSGSSATPAIQGALYLFVVSDSTAVPSPTIAGNCIVEIEQ